MTRWIGVAIIIAVAILGCEPAENVIVADPSEPVNVDTPGNSADASAAFPALLTGDTPVLAMFESSWSSTARQSQLLLAELRGAFPNDIAFILIDAETAPDLVEAHDVSEYPTTLLFDHGQEIARWPGPTAQTILKSDLEQFLQSVAARDALTDDHATEITP